MGMEMLRQQTLEEIGARTSSVRVASYPSEVSVPVCTEVKVPVRAEVSVPVCAEVSVPVCGVMGSNVNTQAINLRRELPGIRLSNSPQGHYRTIRTRSMSPGAAITSTS